jgi:Ca-activated chloride channel family protein
MYTKFPEPAGGPEICDKMDMVVEVVAMRITLCTVLAFLFGPCAPAQSPTPPASGGALSEEEEFGLVIDVRLVSLYCVVLDGDGKAVRDLKKNDFLLWEDEKEQALSHFSTHEEAALSVAILLDTSGSMEYAKKMSHGRTIVKSLAESLGSQDEMALFSFSELFVQKRIPFTKEKEKVVKKMKELIPHGRTALYQALSMMPGIAGVPGHRKAILLLTDGIDNLSIISFKQMLEKARRMEIPIYVVAFSGRPVRPAGPEEEYMRPSVLQAIADETGGSYIEVGSDEDLPEAMEKIASELRFQYALGYSSNQNPRPGTYHTIRLETRNGDYTVRVRKGYTVPP